MWPAVICLIILSISTNTKSQDITIGTLNWPENPMRYVDREEYGQDIFFDRVFSITLRIRNYKNCSYPNRNIATAILLDNRRFLTSYNPFRRFVKSESMKEKMIISGIKGRDYKPKAKIGYKTHHFEIDCGRQIVYLPDEEIQEDQWIGHDRANSPVHDLMILRSSKRLLEFSDLKPNEYTMAKYYNIKSGEISVSVGWFKTELAKPDEELGNRMKFASLGLRSHGDMIRYRRLHAGYFDDVKSVLEDCSVYMPRDWGRFICIRNIHNYKAIGSGAMLFSKDKLFGVGSFVMFREKKSILVFTDIRPYYDNIMNGCSLPETAAAKTS